MKTQGAVVVLALTAAGCSSAFGGPLQVGDVKDGAKIQWSQQEGLPGVVLAGESGHSEPRLVVENNSGMEKRFPLLVLRAPAVTGKVYALRVPVRFQDVQGTGYLETWNYFRNPNGSAQDLSAFTRTLAPVGPLGALNGTSDGWSERTLFFMRDGQRITKVELYLFLPGKGRVELGTLEWLANADAFAGQVGLMSPRSGWKMLVLVGAGLVPVMATIVVIGAVFWRLRRARERRRMLAADVGL